jgi:hypothetical protein
MGIFLACGQTTEDPFTFWRKMRRIQAFTYLFSSRYTSEASCGEPKVATAITVLAPGIADTVRLGQRLAQKIIYLLLVIEID